MKLTSLPLFAAFVICGMAVTSTTRASEEVANAAAADLTQCLVVLDAAFQ